MLSILLKSSPMESKEGVSMGISSVGASSAVSFAMTATNKHDSKAVQSIQRQIDAVLEKISKLENNDKWTARDKQLKKQEYEQELTDLRAQMQQVQMQEKAQEQEKERRKIAEQCEKQTEELQKKQREKQMEENPGLVTDDKMEALSNISSTMEMNSSMSVLRTKMMGEARIQKAEIATDMERGMDTTAKSEQLADTNSAIEQLTGNMIERLNVTANQVREATKEEAEERQEHKKNDTKLLTPKERGEEEEQERKRLMKLGLPGEDVNLSSNILPLDYTPLDVAL